MDNYYFTPTLSSKGKNSRYKNKAKKIIDEMRAEWVPNIKTRYMTSTGNMAFNSLRYNEVEDTIEFYFDEEIAPYIFYTNEPWISPKWNGKKNPNEGWFERFAEEFVRRYTEAIKAMEK